MTALPPIHLCVMQPAGQVHALGLFDPARYFRHQFRRFGAEVTLAKNRLRHDAINFVFGAHLGFDAALRQRYSCVFVNLEQLGDGGAKVSDDYLALLRGSAVCDYDAANVAAYASDPADVPVVPLLQAPYLAPAAPLPLEDRPIDLLFIGSVNARRKALIERIEACGVSVTQFDTALYGPERDHYIAQAKAVLNLHYYPSSRFEQVRASFCLSLGTPVVSERRPQTRPHAAYEDSVTWFDDAALEACFSTHWGRPAWFEQARAQLAGFARHDPVEAYAELLAFAVGYAREHAARRDAAPWQPERLHLGSGKDYKPGWLNLDVLERAQPDLVLDLAQPLSLPLHTHSPQAGPVVLDEGSAKLIYANNVLEHVPDLPALMTNCLRLLAVGGKMLVEVPYERAPTAWQDPTHVRAMNENSWIYYTDWFWYLGWFEHRFEIEASTWLDAKLKPCAKEQAAFMRLTLTKVVTSPRERMTARTQHPDGMFPDDLAWPEAAVDATQDVAPTDVPYADAPLERQPA